MNRHVVNSSDPDVARALQEYRAGNFERSIKLLRRCASQGSSEGMLFLANIYEWGAPGIPPDPVQAFELYVDLARDENLSANLGLGRLYLYGRGVERDMRKALQCFTLVESRGYASGQMMTTLGRMYEFGWGTEVDDKGAEHYYREANRMGNVYGRRYLGLFLKKKGRIFVGSFYVVSAAIRALLIGIKNPNDVRLNEM